MKIIAKKGSKLEEQIKKDYEKKMLLHKEALSLIENKTGIKPHGIGYIWALGYTCLFSSDLIVFENEEKIDKKFFIRNPKNKNVFKINVRTKAGKELSKDFDDKFNNKSLDYRPYQEFGILFQNGLVCYFWEPHKDGDQYMIMCGFSMLEQLKKVENAQYIIEP